MRWVEDVGVGRENRCAVAPGAGLRDDRATDASAKAGPKIVFFSGGTALRTTSRILARASHRTVHLITPFDSGGSSARLRETFPIISVGDLRNRSLALADQNRPGIAAACAFLDQRFDRKASDGDLRGRMEALVRGQAPQFAEMSPELRATLTGWLRSFWIRAGDGMNLRGASIGNLALVGAYFAAVDNLHAALQEWGRVLCVRGIVLPVTLENLHLCARLQDGSTLVGQHRITTRSRSAAPIVSLMLCSDLRSPQPTRGLLDPAILPWIETADLICFPIGSFFTSVMACLLPDGIADAVARSRAPKVYVPNSGLDGESIGWSVEQRLAMLLERLRSPMLSGNPGIDAVLCDPDHSKYAGGLDPKAISRAGVALWERKLVRDRSAPWLDPELLAQALLDAARGFSGQASRKSVEG